MRILIVGSGSVGKRHARNLHQLSCEIGCVDPREDRRHELDKEFEVIGHFHTLTQALDVKWDGAVIASPPAYHLEQGLLLNEHNIPFLMEKNLCLTEDDFQEYSVQVPALMGYTWRFWPSLNELRLKLEMVGEIRRVEFVMAAHLEDWHPWEPVEEFYAAERGGIVNEAHWHDIMLNWFGHPKSVFASIDHISNLNIPSADVLDSLFIYDGFRINMHYDLYKRPHERSMTITGENGTLKWTPNLILFSDDQKGLIHDEWVNDIERNEMFMREAEHFIEVINGAPPLCTLEDGIQVMHLLKQSLLSSEQGRMIFL